MAQGFAVLCEAFKQDIDPGVIAIFAVYYSSGLMLCDLKLLKRRYLLFLALCKI